MTTRRLAIVTLVSLPLLVGLAQAQGPPYCGCYYPPIPQAPDMCNPGYYWTSICGLTYGPVHCVHPPYPPFQGMVSGPPARCGPGGPGGPGGPAGSPTFPTHPYARSPRDFFMYYDKDEPSYSPLSTGYLTPYAPPAIAPLPYTPGPIPPAVPPPAPAPEPGVPPVPGPG
jgi:hypothetical protein